MKKLISLRFLAALGAIAFLASADPITTTSAHADEFTFRIKSSDPNVVHLQFFSDSRNAVWPGAQEVYVLDDYEVQSFPLSCQSGEEICYGAWVQNRSNEYWGVGSENAEGCENCCFICRDNAQSEIIDLNP